MIGGALSIASGLMILVATSWYANRIRIDHETASLQALQGNANVNRYTFIRLTTFEGSPRLSELGSRYILIPSLNPLFQEGVYTPDLPTYSLHLRNELIRTIVFFSQHFKF